MIQEKLDTSPDAQILQSATRWEVSPAGMDKAENDWWKEYADVEEEFCWVQTRAIQKFLRGSYISQIVNTLSPDDLVLELGCGTGWLSVILAEKGITKLYSVDFSEEQIRRAKRLCEERGFTDRIQFVQIKDSLENLAEQLPEIKFDALLIHGVLHHLTNQEIRGIFESFNKKLSKKSSKVFIVEPVLGRQNVNSKYDKLMDFMMGLLMRGKRSGWRKVSSKELEIQNKIDRRNVASLPRGPSPKELPFYQGEMEELLEQYLVIKTKRPVLLFSFHCAKNLLLFQLTYPVLSKLIMWQYLWLARFIERMILKQKTLVTGYTIFELFAAEVKNER